MKRIISAIFFLVPLLCMSQTDVLIFQKNGRNIKTYAPGQQIAIHTIYDQWLDGTVTALRNDSVFINNNPFHVDEIDGIHMEFSKWNYQADGTILIIAGVGVLVLNVVNGLYTNEKSGNWVKTSGWFTAGALILGGLLLKSARHKNYRLGKKYTLHYLNMHVDRPPAETNPGLKTTEPAK
jgi:hypothetical protein